MSTDIDNISSHDSGNIRYIEDIKANAKGYEQLGRIFLAKHRNQIG